MERKQPNTGPGTPLTSFFAASPYVCGVKASWDTKEVYKEVRWGKQLKKDCGHNRMTNNLTIKYKY